MNNVVLEYNKILKISFEKQVDLVINNLYPKNNMLIVCESTPKVLQNAGLYNYPILLTQRHLKTIMNKKGNYKGANYHNLGIDIVKQLPNLLKDPIYILKSNTDDNSLVIVSSKKDYKNRPIIISIKKNGEGYINNKLIKSNVITSAYGRNNYKLFIKKCIKTKKVLYKKKN